MTAARLRHPLIVEKATRVTLAALPAFTQGIRSPTSWCASRLRTCWWHMRGEQW